MFNYPTKGDEMIACHCKKCMITTKHRPVISQPNWFYCEVCGEKRWYAKSFGAGDFSELTHDENEIIHEARAHGFASCFPAFPTAKYQAMRTLKAAEEFLAKMPDR
jgi:hypothetical protein